MIYFITSNKIKISEAKLFFAKLGIEVLPRAIDLIEIQDSDQATVSKAKAVQAYEKLNKPLVVDDAGLFIPSLGGFPGTVTSVTSDTIGLPGVCKLISRDEPAIFAATITYNDGKRIVSFQGKVEGRLNKDRLKAEMKYFSDIFYPDDGAGESLTSLMGNSDYLSHRKQALKQLVEYLKGRKI